MDTKKLGKKIKLARVEADLTQNQLAQKIKAKKGEYTWSHRFKDWESNKSNLEILCSNCHRIHTWEQRNYGIASE